jgi:hypothetical protein
VDLAEKHHRHRSQEDFSENQYSQVDSGSKKQRHYPPPVQDNRVDHGSKQHDDPTVYYNTREIGSKQVSAVIWLHDSLLVNLVREKALSDIAATLASCITGYPTKLLELQP